MSLLVGASDAGVAEVLHEDISAFNQTCRERQETRRHRDPHKRTHQEATRSNRDTVDLRFHGSHRAQPPSGDQSGITPVQPREP
jgi:hypothetical protein